VNVLPAPSSPYTALDASVIEQILQLAESKAYDSFVKGLGGKKITLVKLLKAYEKVLPLHGIQAQEDVYYYRILLKLSLDPDLDWWAKFQQEFNT
jgi:protein SFI1